MELGFCVLCGQSLTDSTTYGIVCTACFLRVYGQHRNHNETIIVHFCYRCGLPLAPRGNEIMHGADQCRAAEAI